MAPSDSSSNPSAQHAEDAPHGKVSSPLIIIFKWLFGLALLAAVVVIVEWQVGWGVALGYWSSIAWFQLLLAFLLFALSHLVRAYRIYDFVLRQSGISFLPAVKLSGFHQFANNLLPMRLGEMVFPLLLKRYFGMAFGQGLSQLIWLRLLDLAVIGSVIAVLVLNQLGFAVQLGFVCSVLLMAIMVLLLRKHISGPLISEWFDDGPLSRYRIITSLFSKLALTAPSDSRQFLRLLTWTIAAWGLKLWAIGIIITALASVTLGAALSGALGAELSGILPIHGVAGAGSYEAAFFAGMALLEAPSSELLAVAVNTHLFVFISTSIVALLSVPIVARPVVHQG